MFTICSCWKYCFNSHISSLRLVSVELEKGCLFCFIQGVYISPIYKLPEVWSEVHQYLSGCIHPLPGLLWKTVPACLWCTGTQFPVAPVSLNGSHTSFSSGCFWCQTSSIRPGERWQSPVYLLHHFLSRLEQDLQGYGTLATPCHCCQCVLGYSRIRNLEPMSSHSLCQ